MEWKFHLPLLRVYIYKKLLKFELKNNELTDKGCGVVRRFSLKRSVMFDKKTGLQTRS